MDINKPDKNSNGAVHMVSAYDELPRTPANFVALSPLRYLERAAYIYPNQAAIIHGERQITWQQTYQRCRQFAHQLRNLGIQKNDTVSVLLPNVPAMIEAHFAVPMAGAVLNTLNTRLDAKTIAFMLTHAESRVLLVDPEFKTLAEEALTLINQDIIVIDVFDEEYDAEQIALGQYEYESWLAQGDPEFEWLLPQDEWDAISLNYTSGTTGFSKGVMLTGNNLAGNVTYAKTLGLMFKGDRELCFLPLAHAYSCTFNFLVPMAVGAHVFLLGKTPTPKILLTAFEEVKPNLILTVPLILEKIYKKMILPQLNKRTVKLALNIPLLDNRIYAQIRKKLNDAMGGRFKEVIVGGAAMNQEVTDFLYKIKFPFTIGYGMTECGPLISYDSNEAFIPGSCGKVLNGIMDVRIDSEDPYNQVGEIQVRGENVMKGYYKNDEATNAVFTQDGWLKTGDLGTIDAEKRIYIRGRSKTMILSSSGQNIFPEEIEAKLNNLPYIMESLVIERDGKLIALVYPDYDTVDGTGIMHTDLPLIMQQNLVEINKLVAPYEKVASIQLYPTEFEKTPKKSIKRYLYSNF